MAGFAARERAFKIALEQRGEWLLGLPLRVLRRKRLHAVEGKEELEIHRLFGPECAVVVEHGDALGGRDEIRSALLRHLRDEFDRWTASAGPSFQDGSESAAWAMVVVIASAQTSAMAMRMLCADGFHDGFPSAGAWLVGPHPPCDECGPVCRVSVSPSMLLLLGLLKHLQHLVHAEARRFLPWRILPERP